MPTSKWSEIKHKKTQEQHDEWKRRHADEIRNLTRPSLRDRVLNALDRIREFRVRAK